MIASDYMLLVNVLIAVAAWLAVVFAVDLYYVTKSHSVFVLLLAVLYMAGLRTYFIFYAPLYSMQLAIPFWVMFPLGIWLLLQSIKKTKRGRRKDDRV